jgi:hypothetical protein
MKVVYGSERHEHITAVVKPAHGGTPTGHVTVKAGRAAICVITLRSARGTCSPAATRLATGRWKITAAYHGSADVTSSGSAVRSLSVGKASSRTALSLSAVKVQYGSERSEKVSVKIAPQYAGTPGGTVTVKADGAKLAVISLRSGKGRLHAFREAAHRRKPHAGGYLRRQRRLQGLDLRQAVPYGVFPSPAESRLPPAHLRGKLLRAG